MIGLASGKHYTDLMARGADVRKVAYGCIWIGTVGRVRVLVVLASANRIEHERSADIRLNHLFRLVMVRSSVGRSLMVGRRREPPVHSGA